MLIGVNVAIVAFGLVMAPLFEAGTAGRRADAWRWAWR